MVVCDDDHDSAMLDGGDDDSVLLDSKVMMTIM